MSLKSILALIRPAHKVPDTVWSSETPLNLKPRFITLFFLVLGLWIFGTGEAILIGAGIGVSPWTVLAQGITEQTGFTVGISTFIVGVLVLLFWIPLRELPGIGTILNIILISMAIDVMNPYIPEQTEMIPAIFQATIGIIFVGIGNVTGPAIGGGITALFGWRAVFLTTAALAGISAILAWFVLASNKQDTSQQQFDWIGAFFCVGFLVALLVGFTLVPEVGWLSIYTLPALVISGFFLFGFVRRSSKVDYPVLDVRLFLKPLFSFSIASNLFCFLGMSSIWFLLPFYLKYIVKYPPEQIGLIFIPAAIAMATLSPLSGKFSDILGWRRFTVGGLLFCSFGLLILSTLNEDTPRWVPLLGVIPVSGGMGAFYGPNNSATLSVTNSQNYGAVISFINLVSI